MSERQLRDRFDAEAMTRHMRDHDTHMGGSADPDGCDECYVSAQGWLRDIHAAVFGDDPRLAGDAGNTLLRLLWAAQDGYGEPGYTPEQGFDWSGIRDSTPATTERMWHIVNDFLAATQS